MHLFGLARGFGDVPEEKEKMWNDYRAELPAGIAVMFMSWICPDYGSGADCKDQWTWLNTEGLEDEKERIWIFIRGNSVLTVLRRTGPSGMRRLRPRP